MLSVCKERHKPEGASSAMQDSVDLRGKICRLPDGQKVRVESQQGSPPRAMVRRLDGPRAGSRAICLVSKLVPLDSDVPIDENAD